jgi:peptide/nickel transport system substrate-binding protein
MRFLPRLHAPRPHVAAAMAAAAALGLTACSGGSPAPSRSATPQAPASKPAPGGTLRIVAASGPTQIDPVPAYYPADYLLERAYTRQLVQYPAVPAPATSGPGWTTGTTPVADVAAAVPTAANGGISDGGRTYTFHIRPGVMWDSTPPRQVTAQDFIREFKAFFNPASPVGNRGYYLDTIAGLSQYASAEARYFASPAHQPAPARIARFQDTHAISGITAAGPLTLTFTLIRPASDFLNMLAMPFASARPAEYDSYLPGSLQLDRHTLSDGPYRIASYLPGRSVTLVRNGAWKQATDPLRHDYVDKIVVTEGVSSAAAQLAQLRAGTQDLPMDTPVSPAALPGLLASNPPNFHVWAWSNIFPYIVFNLRSPDSGGAMKKLLVRRAIEYGVDKAAVQRAYGGPRVATVISSMIPPGNAGYVRGFNPYPDSAGNGDPAKCRSLLAQAGYRHGLSLVYMFPDDALTTGAFNAIQASLRGCGITLKRKREPGSSFFFQIANAPRGGKPGAWDMGQVTWVPDWLGNNGRTIIPPLFGPGCSVGSVNYGCYHSQVVNALIKKAESAGSAAAAAALWHLADQQVMKDAAAVPLLSQNFPLYTSARVRGAGSASAIFAPNIGGADITNLYLSR